MICFLYVLGGELAQSIADAEGDKIANVKSRTLVKGPKTAAILASACYIMVAIIGAFTSFFLGFELEPITPILILFTLLMVFSHYVPARQSGILSGIPATVSASTVNKVCGSGLKAAMFASQAIRAGDADLFVAGGFESMSRAPYLVCGRSGELKFGNRPLTDSLLYDGLWDPFENWGMGNAAEFIADEYEVTREAMDQYALGPHQKAVDAQEQGRFQAEIVPVHIPGRKGEVTIVDHDEGPRKETSLEALAKLKPAFKSDGRVTPDNSSPMSDGGAAVVVASRAYAERNNLKPMARVVGYAQSAVEPKYLFAAPAYAMPKLLKKIGSATPGPIARPATS